VELKKTFQTTFITIIFILASFQAAYAIGDSFTYDANGNMVQGTDGLYYEYNNANQLKRVHVGGPTGEVIAEYWYDHTGKRKKKNENGVVTYYWFDNFEQIVYPNGTVVNITYYSANGERLAKKVSTASGDKTYYFHPDHLGSTSIVSDESGNLEEKTEYYPYGGVKQGGGEQYLFTGKELDKGTGLYYYGARYYNPELTRFAQPDNIIPDAYDPQSLNRYAYVRNNPLKYVDPSGSEPISVDFELKTKPNTEQRIATNFAVTNTPTEQPPSEGEYYNKLQKTAVGNIKVYGINKGASTVVGGLSIGRKIAGKIRGWILGEYEKPAGMLDSALNQDEKYSVFLELNERIKIAKKTGNYDGLGKWIEENGNQYGVYSHYQWTYFLETHSFPTSRGHRTSPSGSTGDYGHESQDTEARYDYDRGKIVRLN